MYYFYKDATCFYNTDGEFGQKTGWLVKLPYMANIGGMTSVSYPIAEIHAKATLVSGNELEMVKEHGVQVSNVEIHKFEIWALDKFYKFSE